MFLVSKKTLFEHTHAYKFGNGLIALLYFLYFITVMVALENMGFIANMVSLVLYFLGVMFFDTASSSNTLTNLMGATFLLTVVGGFISDTYLSRLTTVLIFGVIEILVID